MSLVSLDYVWMYWSRVMLGTIHIIIQKRLTLQNAFSHVHDAHCHIFALRDFGALLHP